MVSGGSRPGAGRPPGKDWNGSGKYEKKVRISVGLPPKLYHWLRAEAERRGMPMSVLLNEAIAALKATT